MAKIASTHSLECTCCAGWCSPGAWTLYSGFNWRHTAATRGSVAPDVSGKSNSGHKLPILYFLWICHTRSQIKFTVRAILAFPLKNGAKPANRVRYCGPEGCGKTSLWPFFPGASIFVQRDNTHRMRLLRQQYALECYRMMVGLWLVPCLCQVAKVQQCCLKCRPWRFES